MYNNACNCLGGMVNKNPCFNVILLSPFILIFVTLCAVVGLLEVFTHHTHNIHSDTNKQDLLSIFFWILSLGNCFKACSCARVRCVNTLSPQAGCPTWGNAEAGAPRTGPVYGRRSAGNGGGRDDGGGDGDGGGCGGADGGGDGGGGAGGGDGGGGGCGGGGGGD